MTDRVLPLAPPHGMEDLLPAAARERTSLLARLLELFATYGFERVITPPFELAEVLERGLELDRRDVMRFVEPESGEVALLRPDITPQIARIVATRLRDRPPPWRLCYHGTVLRRRRGRARRSRQMTQAGVELIGIAEQSADVEALELAARACARVGLRHARIELGQVRLGREILATLDPATKAAATDALSQKDAFELERVLKRARVARSEREALLPLVELYGSRDALTRARRALPGPRAAADIDEVERLWDALEARGIDDDVELGVDFGELRGHAYYTGVSFTILASGPGEPIGGGGRYDNLLGRFGRPAPATGFGLDVTHLLWALRSAGAPWVSPRRRRVVSVDLDATAIDALRRAGVDVAQRSDRNSAALFARSWGYDAVLRAGEHCVIVQRIEQTPDVDDVESDERRLPIEGEFARNDLDALWRWLRHEE